MSQQFSTEGALAVEVMEMGKSSQIGNIVMEMEMIACTLAECSGKELAPICIT
jgi:hypothetical protein